MRAHISTGIVLATLTTSTAATVAPSCMSSRTGTRSCRPQLAAGNVFAVASALECAQKLAISGVPQNLVHRDLSASNMLMSTQGHTKLSDFDVAKVTSRTAHRDGMAKSKAPYMIPEQMAGSDIDGRADLFALGVIFYELLAGWEAKPFRRRGRRSARGGFATGFFQHPLEGLLRIALRPGWPYRASRTWAYCSRSVGPSRMRLSIHVYLPLSLLGLVVLGCEEPSCPKGSYRVKNQCEPDNANPDPPTEGGMPDASADVDGGDSGTDGLCLVDGDGDGFGVEGVFEPCGDAATVQVGDCDDSNRDAYPGAPINRCDGVDNDCDRQDEAPAAEVCNEQDDDCDDVIDDGVANACGTCGELPPETCNWVDDDCSGTGDPNMIERLPVEKVYTLANGGTVEAEVALLRRPGGAWLVYGGWADEFGGPLAFQSLDAQGQPVGSADGSQTAGTAQFAADSDGKWIALLQRKRSTVEAVRDGSNWLQLFLFRAQDMALVASTTLVTNLDDDSQPDDNNDINDCDEVRPIDVGVLEDSEGVVRVAALYEDTTGTMPGATCSGSVKTILQTLKFPMGGPLDRQVALELGAGSLRASVSRVPCRDEWVVIRKASSTPTAIRYSTEGMAGGGTVDTFEGVDSVLAFDAGEENCDGASASMLLVYTVPSSKVLRYGKSYARRWSVDLETGAISRVGEDVVLAPAAGVWAAHMSLGRWFVSGGYTPALVPVVYEVSFDPAEEHVAHTIVLPSGANPGSLWRSTALLSTGNALVTAYSGGSSNNLDTRREPGDTDPAVAATYTLGCP